MSLKKEAELWVARQLKNGLNWKTNNHLSFLITALIQTGATVYSEAPELGASRSLQFKNVNGIPNIKRYKVTGEQYISENIKNVILQYNGSSVEEYVESLMYDLMLIENKLFEAIQIAIAEPGDKSFLESEGITYRLYTDPDSNDNAIGPLRITAIVAENDKGEATVVYKYSTDNAVNMAFKSDIERTSEL